MDEQLFKNKFDEITADFECRLTDMEAKARLIYNRLNLLAGNPQIQGQGGIQGVQGSIGPGAQRTYISLFADMTAMMDLTAGTLKESIELIDKIG